MFISNITPSMPALLSAAFGTTIAERMQSTTNVQNFQNFQNFQNVQKVQKVEKVEKVPPTLGAGVGPTDTANARAHAQQGGNYEIHITIDRHDCHLLCLFLGVFTLSVLFNSNNRRYSNSTPTP